VQIKILNKGYLLLEVTTPEVVLLRKDEFGGYEVGPYITKIETGFFYSKYDYGNILKVKVLGFGLDIWWIV
jgi:hypothetical protein